MSLFTFIMEYAGGTYISQVKSSSAKSASIKWARAIDISQVSGLGIKSKMSLIEQVKDESPSPIDGLQNSWSVCVLIRGKLALVHFIQTETNKK